MHGSISDNKNLVVYIDEVTTGVPVTWLIQMVPYSHGLLIHPFIRLETLRIERITQY